MQKIKPFTIGKICLALLSLSLLTPAFGYEDDNAMVSYLDSVSSSYVRNNHSGGSSLLNMNSRDARGVETTMRLSTTPVISKSNTKVNLTLRDSDIRQALRMLADKGKINIILDNSVQGKITLDLTNISINDAFMVIFKSSHLTYSVDGNTLSVMTKEASKVLDADNQMMTVLPIKYVNSESVADFLNKNLFNSNFLGLSGKSVVTANPRTNQIVVFGTNADVMAVKRVLPVIDTKPLINNFKVNHTTPKEMAQSICQALFLNAKAEGEQQEQKLEEESIILGGGSVACRDNGGTDKAAEAGQSIATFKSNPLTVAYFPELGRITTYGGSVEQAHMISDFIKEHDKKQLMAYVEFSIVQLSETGSKTFDNAWQLWTPFVKLGFNGSSGFSSSMVFKGRRYDNYPGSDIFTYTLQHIIESGNGRILTNPKIMVTNGRKAKIDLTADYVKSVTTQILENSNGTTPVSQRTYEIGDDLGILIELVPFISPDGYVSMNITPEYATIAGREYAIGDTGEEELAATLLQRRDLELKNVRIKDNETLVLAGLIKEEETQSNNKMPILGDLPFIGSFFRSSQNEKSKEELVILITPHIINDSDDSNVYDL